MYRLLTLVLVVMTLSLTACNTFEGVGRDVQKGGEAIEDTATDIKN